MAATVPPGPRRNHARQQRLRQLCALALTGGVALGVAAPASAASGPVDLPGTYVEQVQDEVDEVYPDGDPDFCGDLGFAVSHRAQLCGTFVGTVRGDGIWYFGDRFRGFETWTNPETGHVFRNDFSVPRLTRGDRLTTVRGRQSVSPRLRP